MSIIEHPDWDLSERGRKDAERHRQKIDDAIRKNVRDVIADESIITQKQGKKVRVPVKGLKDYKFIYDTGRGGSGGVGQGKGKGGDKIYEKEKGGQGGPGKEAGREDMDVEVDIDYLLKIMFEELGLPYIEEKTKIETLVPSGWKFDTITKKGIYPRLHKNRTVIEAIKRTAMDAGEIQEATGCDIDDAFRALIQSQHDINEAIEIIKTGKLDKTIDPEEGTFTIDDDDLRYRQIEESYEKQSNAVVIAMMDISGSMGKEKKYLTRSLLFWLTQFLRKAYENVHIKFIVHTTEAKVVNEDDFFGKMSTGGTICASAFELAEYIIDTEYPVSEWNVYCFYSSDGEDFNPDETIKVINRLVDKKVNMIAYAEVNPDSEDGYGWWRDNNLIEHMKKKYNFTMKKTNNTEMYKDEERHIVAGLIKNRTHVWPMLSWMLFDRKKG